MTTSVLDQWGAHLRHSRGASAHTVRAYTADLAAFLAFTGTDPADPGAASALTLRAARAWLEGSFHDRVFVMSFFWNVVVACLLVFLGSQLGVGSAMTTAVVVVLGIRIFSNTASIRRLIFNA